MFYCVAKHIHVINTDNCTYRGQDKKFPVNFGFQKKESKRFKGNGQSRHTMMTTDPN